MLRIANNCLGLLLLCLFITPGSQALGRPKTTGWGSPQSKNNVMGVQAYPYLPRYKGLKSNRGILLSLDSREDSSKAGKSLSSLNFYMAEPRVQGFNSMQLSDFQLEYEGRSYDSNLSYTSAALGVKRLSPNLALKDYFTAQNESVHARYKPFLAFRMGYRILEKIPVIGGSGVLQAAYIISDDFRFPSRGPHGFRKIPLKGFQASLGFKF